MALFLYFSCSEYDCALLSTASQVWDTPAEGVIIKSMLFMCWNVLCQRGVILFCSHRKTTQKVRSKV